MNFQAEYRSKLRTPEEAVSVVKSGDWVDYSGNVCFPMLLDGGLQLKTAYESNNFKRVVTGFFFGYGLMTLAALLCISGYRLGYRLGTGQ